MPDTVNGLPVHPLVVHAVVVLLPLACLGVIAIALRGAWRVRYGGPVLVVAVLATLAIPVASDSGEHLAEKVGDPGQHAVLGDRLIWFALPLVAVAAALYALGRRAARAGVAAGDDGAAGVAPAGGSRSTLTLAVAAIAVIVAGANLIQVYRVGDSGARAVWQGVQNVPTPDR